MSSNNFVFPPPPQAGPQSYPYAPTSTYSNYASHTSNTRGYRNRGRGGGFRSSRGQSSYNGQAPGRNDYTTPNNTYNTYTNGYTSPNYPLPSYPSINQPQHPAQSVHNGYANGYRMSQAYSGGAYGNQQSQYAMANGSTGYNTGYLSQQMQQPSNPQPIAMGPPIRMGFDNQSANNRAHGQERAVGTGPSVRIGNHHDALSHVQALQDPRIPQNNSPNHINGNRGRGQKRIHSEAFSHSRGPKHRLSGIPAPPAVPSFGNPLPVKPPAPEDAAKKPKKKKRKHNQLGLTPKTEEHESSEEDEEIDEEAKLAAVQRGTSQGPQQGFQFSYNGRQAALKTPLDVAAWVAERKKRYPTKARIEEKTKRKEEEAMNARNRREEQRKVRKEAVEHKRSDHDKEAKAKIKAEKLRKQYEKAQRRVAEMEAKKVKSEQADARTVEGEPNFTGQVVKDDINAEEKTTAVNGDHQIHSQAETSLQSLDSSVGLPRSIGGSDPKKVERLNLNLGENAAVTDDETGTSIANNISNTQFSGPNPLTPTSQPMSPNVPTSLHQAESPSPSQTVDHIPKDLPSNSSQLLSYSQTMENETDSIHSLSDTSSDTSSDLSSDDSKDSSSDDSSSSDDVPNEATSKRIGPTKVEPSRPTKKTPICKVFLASGRCKRGDQCHYLHELPERGTATREKATRGNGKRNVERGERMTLYQRMVTQEKDKEDEVLLQHIIFLGEQGALDEPKGQGKSKSSPEAE